VQSVNLAWSPSPDTNVVGYRVYYGVVSRTYTNMVDVGAATNATISGLVEGATYYFAATAYNVLGLESDFSTEVSYTIPGGGVNQAPTLNALSNLTINEDAGLQTVNLSGITSGASNEVQTLIVAASSGNTGLIPNPTVTYTSANTTGTLTFTPVANASGSATITVTVNDGGATNSTVTRTFTVTVNAVNDVPTLNALNNLTINEDAGLQTVNLAGVTSGAGNEAQTLIVAASSGNTGLIPNPTVTYTSANTTGTLTFTPVANASGSATITVTVSDGGGSNNIVTRTFTVSVNAVNDVPTLNAPGNLTINENAGIQTVNLSGITSGASNEAQTLIVAASSGNTGLIPNPTVTYTSANTTGTLTFTPVTNASGSATITVTVSDGGASNNIVTRTFTVTVNAVNDAPTITTIASQTIATNTSAGPIAFTIGDAETAAASLTLRATSSAATLIPTNNITFGGSGSNRTVTLTPLPNQSGSATITIIVSDGSATTSTTFQLTVLGSPAPPVGFTLVISGNGMVSPDLNLQPMTVGQTYTVTAIPAVSNMFAGWSGGIASADPKLTFVMTTNLVLQANFVPAALDQAAGTYSGLFYEGDEVRTTSAGAFTVKVTARGTYSGRLQTGTSRGSFSGKLDSQGQATNTIYPKGGSAVTVDLRIGAGAYADRMFGHVANSAFSADLQGDRAVFNAKTNPAGFAGNFTLLLPGLCDGTTVTLGDGFGTVRVGANGKLRFKGILADGTKVSQGAVVSKNGEWPLYVPLYRGQGLVLSWLTFTNQADSDLIGKLSWVKLPSFMTQYYPLGLTNECDAVGSTFVRPIGSAIVDLPSGRVKMSGGDLVADFTNSVTLGPDNKVVGTSGSPLTMSFSLSAGTFTGKATDPTTGQPLPFRGVVLQKRNRGYGFLLGSDQSSQVVFEP
jgi:oxalate decarboxylase/phosphoglucose isomerase-like protein (cupin superfamily)